MIRKALRILFLALIFALLPIRIHAQTKKGSIFRNKYKEENKELKARIDSLLKTIDDLHKDIILKDSLAQEMLSIYEENEDKSAAGLNPEDYSPELTDSLLNIWYLHRQVNADNVNESYDMDSVHFTSNVSDEILQSRLESMNSFITLPYNPVRGYG